MNFELSEEQDLLRKTIREFAEGEIKPKIFELDRKEEFSIELTQKMGEMGLLGMAVDPNTFSYFGKKSSRGLGVGRGFMFIWMVRGLRSQLFIV